MAELEQNTGETIETDQDTIAEDKIEDGGLYPYDPAYTNIEIGEEPFSHIRVFEATRQRKNHYSA